MNQIDTPFLLEDLDVDLIANRNYLFMNFEQKVGALYMKVSL